MGWWSEQCNIFIKVCFPLVELANTTMGDTSKMKEKKCDQEALLSTEAAITLGGLHPRHVLEFSAPESQH
jgi:hypothetical protein